VLTVTSPEGGEYLCELVGSCSAPMPQGPYTVVQGGGAVEIPYRNCFSTTATWAFSLDNAHFRVTAPAPASVNPKTQAQCSVVYEPKEGSTAGGAGGGGVGGGVVAAKLFITCTSIPNIPPWIFYLRGQAAPEGAVPVGKKK
jgi:hypothetical protein